MKCFGYARVSTAKQGEGVSLEAQQEAITRFAAQNDITIDKWFVERETAAKSGRPFFNEMIRLLKMRRADGVVMHKIDRSARNFADWAKIGDLADAGIKVYFTTESLDFQSRGGRLSADIQAVIAADYIRNLRDEIKKGIYGRLNQGLYPFGAPIGYLDQGGGELKTPDPVRAPLIRKAFELYGSGNHSFRSLRLELLRLGLRNRNDRPLSKCGLETIIGNPFYCGLIRIRKTGAVYAGRHEPLISVELFETVQEIRAGKSSKRVTRHNHIYRGLFRCFLCGDAMTPERQKGHVYYRCQNRDCATKCVREEALETAVEKVLSRPRLSDEHMNWFTTQFETRWKARQLARSSNGAAMQLGQIDARLERLTDALLDQVIDESEFSKRKEKLLLERRKVEKSLEDSKTRRDDISYVRRFLELIKSLATTYILAAPDGKREIVQIATSNRSVAEKDIYLEPANWLLRAEEAITGLTSPHDRTTYRTPTEMDEKQIQTLVSLARSRDVAHIAELTRCP